MARSKPTDRYKDKEFAPLVSAEMKRAGIPKKMQAMEVHDKNHDDGKATLKRGEKRNG